MEIVLMLLILMVVLIMINVPISYSIGIVSVSYFFIKDISLLTIPQRMYSTIDTSTLFAIPLFLLAGMLMNKAEVTDKLYHLAFTLIGHIRGGLAHVNVLSSMMFASMTGSAMADIVGLGTVSANAMEKKGFKKTFAAAVSLSASTITPIIPPSIILIVYGVVAEVSIGRLFLAGILPGLAIGLSLMLYIYLISFKRDFPREKTRASFRAVLEAFRHAILPLFMPVIILGGILLGIFTPTEAGAVAVLYVLIIGFFVYKKLTVKIVIDTLKEVATTSSVILLLISISGILGWIITIEQVPVLLTDSLLSLTSNPIIILLLINVIILVAGMFLDATPIVLMLVPVFMPILLKIGVDPVHFGIIIGVNTMIGVTTPPVGAGLYAISGALKINVMDVIKEMLPMWGALFVILLIITFWPGLSLMIPNLVFGK